MRSKGRYILPAMLLAACVSWMSCGEDSPASSDGNVDNTDFLAEESFYFRINVVDQTRFRLVAISGSISDRHRTAPRSADQAAYLHRSFFSPLNPPRLPLSQWSSGATR